MQNQPKVKYNVQRYVQIGGVQYGVGVYEIPENIARALDQQGAGARQEEFIQAVAGDAPVIDASANALQTQTQGNTGNIPSGIIANTAGEGSPNAPAPKETIQDSSGGGFQQAQPLGNMMMNSQGDQPNQPQGGAGMPQNHRTDVENQTVKTETSNLQSLDQNQVQNLQQNQTQGAGGGSGVGGSNVPDPNANQSQGNQSQGATGELPEGFPHKEDLANADQPIKTFEDLIPKTQDELLKIKGIGKAGVRDIGLAVYTAKQQSENS